jgi:hypothetical protein
LLNRNGFEADPFDPPGVALIGALKPKTGAFGAVPGCVGREVGVLLGARILLGPRVEEGAVVDPFLLKKLGILELPDESVVVAAGLEGLD